MLLPADEQNILLPEPDRIMVKGGVPLRGDVTLSGCKNGALPILAATLLVEDEVVLENVPQISDIDKMIQLIAYLGAKVERTGHTVRVNASHLTTAQADRDLVAAMRASFDVVGPLLARFGHARIPLPGGCAIGNRPVDYVIDALQNLGVQATEQTDEVLFSTPDGLHGGTVTLNPVYRPVRATFIVAMAATLAKGRTIIENASPDPEVESFCQFLQATGVHIEGAGTDRLVIDGCRRLQGCAHAILPDRIEAGTYLLAAAATRGEVRVGPIAPGTLGALLGKLEEMGLQVEQGRDWASVAYRARPVGATVYTSPYPGFPTDIQPPMVVLMCLAQGNSAITEGIYDGRLTYINELRRMGAQVKLENSRQALITGVDELQGRNVEGADMRASAALVIAALAAQGESLVTGRHYILRG
ncbi:MAG TPA: UDP-N-acetylglucosamine 1-carboxyvinyltransferase, partial [Armatimonadota bacterium]